MLEDHFLYRGFRGSLFQVCAGISIFVIVSLTLAKQLYSKYMWQRESLSPYLYKSVEKQHFHFINTERLTSWRDKQKAKHMSCIIYKICNVCDFGYYKWPYCNFCNILINGLALHLSTWFGFSFLKNWLHEGTAIG